MSSVPVLPIDSGRYGSVESKAIFTEESRLKYMLEVEAAVANAEASLRLIPLKAAKEIALKSNVKLVSYEKWKEIEKTTKHETASLVEALVSVVSDESKPWVHYGLTSQDILDTSLSLQLKDYIELIEGKLKNLILLLGKNAEKYLSLTSVGRTHGQHASIISFGQKFAVWADDCMLHMNRLSEIRPRVMMCKTLGVVGNGSVIGSKALEVMEITASKLGLYPVSSATQVVSRENYAEFVWWCALVASTCDKIATEFRNLSRTEISEFEEEFSKDQIGSSAVPSKRNPISCEKISSLARLLRSLPTVALENIPLWHERDLTNSANERFIIPMSAILLDDVLDTLLKVLAKMVIREDMVKANIEITMGQVYSEFVLDVLLKKEISRSEAHKILREVSSKSRSKGIQFKSAIMEDERINRLISEDELNRIFIPEAHIEGSQAIIKGTLKRIKEKLGK
ncbi:MAG: adenylosuccinate lyase [Nitrososphaeria archaeon]|jgi:adenylosuccinate lyase